MTDDELGAIAALMAAGDDQAAYARLRARLAWPGGRDLSASEFPRWIEVLGELAERRRSLPLAELASSVVRDPDNPDGLYELGYAMIDASAPMVAASILWRCLALVGDSEEVVTELVSALESGLAYNDAFEVLEQHAPLRARSFLVRYLYAFNAAMTGRLAVTRAVLPALVPNSPETIALRETIAGIVERAERVVGPCALDARDLRGWHYVLTGGLLLHESPYGHDEPMHGRYAWLADSIPRLATSLARLADLVRDLGLPCVYAPPGPSHEIAARVVAAMLGLPIAIWPAVGVPAPGLVVLYDLADLELALVPQLVHRRPDQILFAHASPWTIDGPIAPDVTTLLYQTLVPPWSEPDSEAMVQQVLASPGLAPEELVADDPVRWRALVARTWPLTPAPRSRLWAGGPVSSNRFT